jgi:hypothetical protein
MTGDLLEMEKFEKPRMWLKDKVKMDLKETDLGTGRCVELITDRWCILVSEILSLQILIPDDGGSTHLWNVGRQ